MHGQSLDGLSPISRGGGSRNSTNCMFRLLWQLPATSGESLSLVLLPPDKDPWRWPSSMSATDFSGSVYCSPELLLGLRASKLLWQWGKVPLQLPNTSQRCVLSFFSMMIIVNCYTSVLIARNGHCGCGVAPSVSCRLLFPVFLGQDILKR